MKDMNRVKVTVIGVIAALAVNFMGVDKVQAQEFKIQGDLVSSGILIRTDRHDILQAVHLAENHF